MLKNAIPTKFKQWFWNIPFGLMYTYVFWVFIKRMYYTADYSLFADIIINVLRMKFVMEYPIYTLLIVLGVCTALIFFLMKTDEGRYLKKIIGVILVIILAIGYNVETKIIVQSQKNNEITDSTDVAPTIATKPKADTVKYYAKKINSEVKKAIKYDSLKLEQFEISDIKIDTEIFGKRHVKGKYNIDLFHVNTPELQELYYQLEFMTPKERHKAISRKFIRLSN